MAFTAVHYSMDKDQNQFSYWQDNDELAVTGDTFFDQFVTFDNGDPTGLGGDLLEDPPSPSILLDSLEDSLTNSFPNAQDIQPGHHQAGTVATTTSDPLTLPPPPTEAEQSSSVPAVLTALAEDPVLSNGSISDSELLRLEGISLRSPKRNATAPSSPPFESTTPSSPRKHNRLVESVYATIRRATHRTKQPTEYHPHSTNMTTVDDEFRGDTRDLRSRHDVSSSDMNHYTDNRLEVKQKPIDSNGLSLSPPLTGRIPTDQRSNNMRFVSGRLDDPFCDDLLAPSAVVHPSQSHNNNTPMTTPVLNGDSFYQHALATLDTSSNSYRRRPKQQRNTSSAEWPMEGLLTDDANMWSSSSSSAAYIPDSGDMASPGWWEPSHNNDDSSHAHSHSQSHHQHQHNSRSNNASLNLSMHNQQAELPYEYSNHGDLSGLMIHMPQPRQPQAAVLSANINEALSASASNYRMPGGGGGGGGNSHHSHSHSHHSSSSHYGGHSEHRRPRPRAPSSGARHHGSLTSPRKLHHSGSRPYLREESMSPTPTARQRSGSISVRKRRSWCRRQQQQQQYQQQQQHQGGGSAEPRTPSSSTPSSFGGGGGMGGIDFVNFTPSDKNVLMTGVAPSGSSKTKARREKEAMDKRRRISEAALRAVQAAGGDIDKLVEEGFVL